MVKKNVSNKMFIYIYFEINTNCCANTALYLGLVFIVYGLIVTKNKRKLHFACRMTIKRNKMNTLGDICGVVSFLCSTFIRGAC